MRHIKKNDQVEVIAGKHKGERGKVLEVITKSDRVRIEGINTVKRHTKPNQQVPEGGIIEKFGTIHISNVLPIDPKDNKPTRVKMQTLKDGRKVRVAVRSGEVMN